VEKGTDTLVLAVKDHFAREWDMLEELIGNIPDDEWTKGVVGQVIPVQHVVHIVVGADAFVGDIPFEEYDPSEFLGQEAKEGGPWTITPEELWSREVALQKLVEMGAIVDGLLTELDDAALLKPEEVHPWTGQTRMGKMLYTLRHIQHHLGELDAELSRRGIKGYRRWD
jgi:hypothetical protein